NGLTPVVSQSLIFGVVPPLSPLSLPFSTQVAAGGAHSMALANDGTVWVWGYNDGGNLCLPTSVTSCPYPIRAAALSNISAISCGSAFNMALRSDGTVWSWGAGPSGQLGNGTNPASDYIPVQASNLTGVTAISGGLLHAVALKNDGTV